LTIKDKKTQKGCRVLAVSVFQNKGSSQKHVLNDLWLKTSDLEEKKRKIVT
jgi:hypothetical protein